LAGQEDLLESFREGRDVYSEFATDVYGRTITKDKYTERFVGKTCILGLGYGMGAEKFQRTLALSKIEIDEFEAQRIVRLYRQKYHKIVALWQLCGHALTNMAVGKPGTINDILDYDDTGITLPNKMKIIYPALRQNGRDFQYINDARTYRKFLKDRVLGLPLDDLPWTKIYGGKVVENLVQARAGIIVRKQMVDMGLAGYFVAFQVHDENVAVVPTETADAAEEHIVRIMSTPPVWAPELPVACEVGRALNYGDC
jgi:DNA polymerase